MRTVLIFTCILFSGLKVISCKKEKDNVPAGTGNQRPVANAGADQLIILPTDSVELNGSGTDRDGIIINYSWNMISGPPTFTMVNPNAAVTKVKNLVTGLYRFELKVTDNNGLSATDDVFISVISVQPPLPGSSCPTINGQFVPVATPPGAGGRPVAAAGNKILFLGGGASVNIYDMVTNIWTAAGLSLSRQNMAISSIGDKIFFAGGAEVTELWPGEYLFTLTSRVDIYNATTNTWSTAELSQPRELFVAASAGSKILFAGGVFYDNASNNYQPPISSSTVDIYDMITNTWSVASLSEGRSSLSAAVADNKIYFAGGVFGTGTNSPGFSNKIDIYDAITNSWSVSSLSCEGKAQMASIAAGNKIFWAGGSTSFLPLFSNKVEIRELTTQTSSCVQLCHLQGSWHTGGDAVLKDNKVVFYNRYEGLFEVYNISEDKWYVLQPGSSLKGVGIISVNNIIYAGGGFNWGVPSNQVWKLEF